MNATRIDRWRLRCESGPVRFTVPVEPSADGSVLFVYFDPGMPAADQFKWKQFLTAALLREGLTAEFPKGEQDAN